MVNVSRDGINVVRNEGPGPPRLTLLLLVHLRAHAGDPDLLGYEDVEPGRHIFLCPFVNLQGGTVLGV